MCFWCLLTSSVEFVILTSPVSYVSAYIVTKSMFLWNMVLNLWISWSTIPKMWTSWSTIPKMWTSWSTIPKIWTLRSTISYLTVNIQGTSLEIHTFMWTFWGCHWWPLNSTNIFVDFYWAVEFIFFWILSK